MAGEHTQAEALIKHAIQQADTNASMSGDAMRRAILSSILKLSAEQAGIGNTTDEVNYLLENMGSDEQVITRGC